MPIFNDLNLGEWKESEIWTDSLWIINIKKEYGGIEHYQVITIFLNTSIF